jgi:hypothetical protein
VDYERGNLFQTDLVVLLSLCSCFGISILHLWFVFRSLISIVNTAPQNNLSYRIFYFVPRYLELGYFHLSYLWFAASPAEYETVLRCKPRWHHSDVNIYAL